MIKINQNIEIVRSSIKGLSSMNKESSDAIQAVLVEYYTSVRASIVNNLSDLEAVAARAPDLVFLGMEFLPVNPSLGWLDSHKIWLTTYFDEHGITYTGSGQTAHKLERNKHLAKLCVQDAGLRTAPFFVIKQKQLALRAEMPLSFPVFIKPANRGGGLGVDSDSLVHNFEQLQSKVQTIADLQSDSLIEEYLPGREFSVALLKEIDSAEFSAMPIELIAPLGSQGERILSDAVKSANAEQAIEVSDKVIKARVSSLALAVFYALGAQDYGRIDIRLDEQGIPHFLEANLLPSLISGYGSFPKACALNLGLAYEPMILRIVRLGLARNTNNIENALQLSPVIDDVFPSFETSLEPI